MPEKWERELERLRSVERPAGLEDRMREGPRGESGRPTRERVAAAVVAFAVCAALGVVAVTALRNDGGPTPVANPGISDPDAVVVELGSNADGPTAVVRYGDRSQDAVFEGASWCPDDAASGNCTSYIADFAFYPPVSEFLVVPPGTPIEVTGEGSFGDAVVTDRDGEPIDGVDASIVPSSDGTYVFDVHGTWPHGEGDFFFGIQALSSPAAAPDVLTVDCSSFFARLDTAVVRTQADGLHVRFTGSEGARAFEIVDPAGELYAVGGEATGDVRPTWAVPPGSWAAGCGRDVNLESAVPFDLIDPDDHYAPPQLTCTEVETTFFTSNLPTSVGPDEAAPQLLAGVDETDVVRGAGYGADTWHLGWTYVVDRDGEAVVRIVLGEEGSTWGGQYEACTGSGVSLSDAAVAGVGPETPVTGPTTPTGSGATGASGTGTADTLVVRCEGLGPAADAAVVAIQPDGVHIEASNIADAAAVVIEDANGEVVAGPVMFDEVTESFVVPLEPGTYWFGCRVLDEQTGEIDGTHVERPEAYVVFEVQPPAD